MYIIMAICCLSIVLSGCNKDSQTTTDQGTTTNDTKSEAKADKETKDKQEEKEEVVELKWSTWGNPGELEKFYNFTDNFNAANADMNIELIPVPDGYEQKILTQLAANTAPDMFYSSTSSVNKFIRADQLLDLKPYLDKSDTLSTENVFEPLFGAAKQDGKIYGVPVDCNPMVFYYNKDLIKEAGAKTPQEYIEENGDWTYDDFAELTRTVAANGKRGFILQNWYGPAEMWLFSDSYKVYDTVNGKHSVRVNRPEIVKKVQFLVDLIGEDAVTYEKGLPKGQGADAMFMSGQVAMVTAGRWYVPMFKEITTFDWDIAPVPLNFEGNREFSISTSYAVVNANSKHPEKAFRFVEAFCNAAGQTFRLSGGGNAVPSYNDAELDKVVTDGNMPPHAQYFLDMRSEGYVKLIQPQLVPEASKEVTDGLDLIYLGEMSVEEGLAMIDEKANKKFEEAAE